MVLIHFEFLVWLPMSGYFVIHYIGISLLICLNWDLIIANPLQLAMLSTSIITTFALYLKTSLTDPGTVKSQIFLNQNTD